MLWLVAMRAATRLLGVLGTTGLTERDATDLSVDLLNNRLAEYPSLHAFEALTGGFHRSTSA